MLILSIIFGIAAPCTYAASKLEVAGWDIEKSGKTTVEIDTDIQRSGRAIKISTDNYAVVSTKVDVEKGKSYTLEFFNKANNMSDASVTIQGNGYSLKPLSNTFEWSHHKFTYTHNADSGKITISFRVSGKTDAYWLDYPAFKNEKGENLISNPMFEKKQISVKPNVGADATPEELFYAIQSSDSFSASDLEKVQAGFRTIPVQQANNIVIDGNGDDWSNYGAMAIPVLSEQTRVLIDSLGEKGKKNHAEVKFAYDENKFYFYAEVYDENHVYVDGATYWQADSIQFTLSRLSDSYGYEIGLMYNSDEDKGKIYTTALTDTEIQAMDFAAKRDGNITKYEISIPWTIYYGAKCPDDMLFDLLVNENTGEGRAVCYEFAPEGISEFKTNEKFPYLQFLTDDKNWYGWIEGERKPTAGEEETYSLFIVNYGETREFELTMPDGEKDSVTIEQGKGIRYEFTHTFTETGSMELPVTIGEDESISIDVIAMPGMEKVEKYVKIFEKDLKEVESLIKACDKKNIVHDNETAYYEIVKRFMQYMQEDAQRDDFSKTEYFIEKLENLLTKSKDNLNKYLSGEKESVSVPKYVTTETYESVGTDIFANTIIDGKEEKRPVYYVGFGHFGLAGNDMPLFPKLGYNAIQMEIGPDTFLRPRGNVPYWGLDCVNGADVKTEVSSQQKASGSNSLSVVGKTGHTPNVFAAIFQDVAVEPNTEYKFGFKIKAKQAEGMWYTMNGYDDRNFITQDVSDWTDISCTYTTKADQTTSVFRIYVDGITTECYIDDIYIQKASGGENLIKNGDFEKEDDGKKWAGTIIYSDSIMRYIKSAEENNIALNLLISPHYLTAGVYEAYPEMKKGTKYTHPGYNVNSDIARVYIEDYLRIIIPLVKDCKSVQTICMANEPGMVAASMPWFYQPKWEEYLKNKYGTIENLNKAWAESYDSFEGIAMPDSQSYDMRFYDFVKFNDEQFAEWFRFMKDIIREYTDKPVQVKIMNTMGEQDHQGVDRRYKMYLAQSPETYAEYSEISGNDCILYPNWVKAGEEGELEKSFYYDYLTSLNDVPVNNSEDHIINDQDANYEDFYADFVNTDIWQGALHGRTISNVWTWERANGNSASLFNGLFLDRPDCVAAVSDSAIDLNRYAVEVSAVKNEKRDIAILYSISSRVFQTDYMNAVYRAYEACSYNGKHPMIINEEQIDKIMNCDMLVIPHAVHCTAAATAKIKEFIEQGGKVLILGSDCLKYTEETQTENDKEVRDYIFANSKFAECKADGNFLAEPSDKDFSDIVESFLKENNRQYIRLINTETGDTTDNVEWLYGVSDGKIYVNINNYNIDVPLTVNIEVDGRIVESAKELRSREETGKDIVIKPYSPILLEVETDNTFFDTYGHWGEQEIKELADEKIINGVSATRFAPNSKITRAEFLTLCLKAIGEETGSKVTSFSDVSEDDWFAGVIAKAEKIGLCSEMKSGSEIEPNKPITREEIMTVLAKAYEHEGKAFIKNTSENFTDIENIGEKFKPYVEKAIGMGWVKGDNGKLLPDNTSTRAEAAALIGRFLKDLR